MAAFSRETFSGFTFDTNRVSMGKAFSRKTFSRHTFSVNDAPAQPVGGGGVFHGIRYRTRTAEELRDERIRLGIISAPVKRAVVKAARKAIEETPAAVDPLVWLQEQYDRRQLLLAKELEAKRIEFQQQYMLLMKIEIELILQRREEEAIVHILMEM